LDYIDFYPIKRYEPDNEAFVELRNGRFVDVMNGCFFDPNVRILIKGTKIAVMPNIESGPTPNYSIDLQGKAVIPGLFNTHCHVNMTAPILSFSLKGMRLQKKFYMQQIARNMSECLLHGITNIRDAFSTDLAGTKALKSLYDRKTGPRILQSVAVAPSGSYFASHGGIAKIIMGNSVWGGPDHHRSQSGVVEIPMDASVSQVRDAVNKAIDERGAEAIKIGEQRYSVFTLKPDWTIMTIEQLRALADQARKRGIQTLMHHMSVESFRRAIEAGISSLSHLPFDDDLTPEDITAFIASGCVIEPTVSTVYDSCWKINGDPYKNHPDVELLCEYRANEKSFANIADDFYIDELREMVSHLQTRFSRGDFTALGLIDMTRFFRAATSLVACGIGNFRKLYQSGAPIALANDGGAVVCTPPMMGFELTLFKLFLNQEPGKVILKGADALRIATINSARSMGLDAQFGTLETGKTADIAIVDGDPFTDFRVIGSRVAALFMDGLMVINNCGLKVEPVKTA
jgi:imidazolonepropionase-like amidohydrolase